MNFAAEYDVVVVGGGIAGVAAALQAARSGKKTALLEKTVLLGGLATTGMIYIYLPLCDGNGRQLTFGICEELIRLSLKYGPGEIPANWTNGKDLPESKRYRCIFSPAAFMLALDEILETAGVDLWLDTLVCDAVVVNNKLTEVIVENKSGRGSLRAGCFIDASGDCDVARRAGVPCQATENYLSMWALQYNAESRGGLADSIHMLATGAYATGGHNMPPELLERTGLTQETLRAGEGLSGKKVTEFVLGGRRILREYYKLAQENGVDRNHRFLLKLPAMAQFRKTYCIEGEHVLAEGEDHMRFEDSIGLVGDWRKAGPAWEIPYRSLYPKNRLGGLLAAGRCTAASGDAWEITRVIPTAAMTGQAAGLAAALALDADVDPADLDVKILQDALRKLGFKLHLDEVGLGYAHN